MVSFSVVSECGASIYSATKLAAEELPKTDIELRSAGDFSGFGYCSGRNSHCL